MGNLKKQFSNLSLTKRKLILKKLKKQESITEKDNQQKISPILQVSRERDLPLSFAQERLWFLDRLIPDNPFYNIPMAYSFKGHLNIPALRQTLEEIIRRHESLRTRFEMIGGEPRQIIEEEIPALPHLMDLSILNNSEREEESLRIMKEESILLFDLEKDLMLRAKLLLIDEKEYTLLITMHHIASDAWSIGILQKELTQLYSAFSQGEPSPLPVLPIQYADFVVWQRKWFSEDVLDDQLSYWREQLSSITLFEIPTDHIRPTIQTFRGNALYFNIEPEITEKLRLLSRERGASLYMMLLSAFSVLLSRYSGQEDIAVGSPISNRKHKELENLIGFFVNTLVMRTDVSGNPTFLELMGRVKQVALDAYENQDIPFEHLVVELQPERAMSRNPLVQIAFTLQKAPGSSFKVPGWSLSPIRTEVQTVRYDIEVTLLEISEGLGIQFNYATDLFEPSTIFRMIKHFSKLLEEIVEDPGRRISEISMFSKEETYEILVKWNDTATEYLKDKCIHELFETQVEKTPDALAVVSENEQISYRELNIRANQLAHYLVDLGVEPDSLAGIEVERDSHMLTGILAILKAGGAYVPLDPEYPEDRLSFMLEDSAPMVVLTQSSLKDSLRYLPNYIPIIDLDSEAVNWKEYSSQNVEKRGVTSNQLAYVIYTSGSTGAPKGVMVEHGDIVRLFSATDDWYHFDNNDVWTLFHSYAFDFSVWEIWGALLYGGKVVVVPKMISRSPEEFFNLICREDVTILNQTPSAFKQLINAQKRIVESHSIREVIFGGEALEVSILKPWYDRNDSGNTQLVNMYGITETTVHVTYYPLSPEDMNRNGASPIGSRIPDLRIYILDKNGEPLPIGVTGEIYVGGEGVARGYLKRPELTTERFLPDPFTREANARIYRTGDLGRLMPDGSIDFIGRNDHQVKIRGYRIELGEIESCLREIEEIKEALVLVREDMPGEKRLVAYLIIDEKRASTTWKIFQFEKKDRIKKQQLYELPNGMVIGYLNKSETDFMYEEIFEEQNYLKHGITINDGDCIFDVGANIGLFTLFAARQCKNVSIYAIEPLSPVFELLSLNTDLYGINTKLINCGISSKPGTEKFTYYPYVTILSGRYGDTADEKESVKTFINTQLERGKNNEMISSDEIDELLEDRLKSENIECQMTTISDLIQENDIRQIDLLKIDAEKSELDVFAGIKLDDWEKIKQIVVEVHDIDGQLGEVKKRLKIHGYDIVTEQIAMLKETTMYNVFARRLSMVSDDFKEVDSKPLQSLQLYANTPDKLIAEIRNYLKDKLPEYMIPSAYVLLEKLPLTPNGKTDRKSLPAPEGDAYSRGVYEAPIGEVEEILSSIWSEVLNVEEVSRNDNFFDLGGHSLLAVQLISRLRTHLDIEVDLREFFSNPNLKDFALSIRKSIASDLPEIIRAERSGDLPLSFAQQRLWFIDRLEKKAGQAYHIPLGFRIIGGLNRNALCAALDRIVERHEALRTTFDSIDGIPVQKIASPHIGFALEDHDISDLSEIEVWNIIEKEATEPFDLSTGPLIRGRLLKKMEEEHIILITMHHIVSDGWSMGIFMNELSTLYQSFSQGKPDPLPELSIQYVDYAVWQRNWLKDEILENQLNYWKTHLSGAPELLELPVDKSRPAVQDYSGASINIHFDAEFTRELKAFSRRHGVTMFMTLMTGWTILLSRLSGKEDLVVGSPVANRTRSEIEPLIGFFVNTLIIRSDLSGDPIVSDLMGMVRDTTLSAQKHQDIPFEQLVEELQPERSLSYSPLFQVIFAWQSNPVRRADMEGLTLERIGSPQVTAKFDLSLFLQEFGDEIVGSINYATALFERDTVERYIEYFRILLWSLISNENHRINQLELISPAEITQVLYDWNDTYAEYPDDKCIQELIEKQAEKTPDAVAVVFESEQISYRDLDKKSNQLARYLQSHGVRAEVPVGICMDRSLDLIIGILGILKAGGVYLPLDSDYPEDRLELMISDSNATMILTEEKVVNYFPKLVNNENHSTETMLICLDSVWEDINKGRDENILTNVTNQNSAYIIYTSGSTGKPKGVIGNHKGLCNLMNSQTRRFGVNPASRIFQFASLSFDASISEIIMALCSGAVLHMEQKSLMIPGHDLEDMLNKYIITHITLPPSALALMNPENIKTVRQMIIAGEAFSSDLAKRWHNKLRLINAYGPTESTVCATMGEYVDAWLEPYIGVPIDNTQVYVLDPCNNPVPVRVSGELYIGGIGLSHGYNNQPELTAEEFIPASFINNRGSRLYKSGDLARYLPDGNIDFIGRIDHQVKIRGFRIELGEIESIMMEHTGIRGVIVTVREDQPGDKRLIAYIIPSQDHETDIGDIREYLMMKLPEYMIPSAFVILEEMPLTPNGKVDRKSLPVPDRSGLEKEYVAPRTEIEKRLVEIWAEVLNLDKIGICDNFFEIGGHSLLATQVMSGIKDVFLVAMPVLEIFEAQTIEELSMKIVRVMKTQSDANSIDAEDESEIVEKIFN